MKNKGKNLLVALLLVGLSILIIFLIADYPIVLDYSKDVSDRSLENYKPGDTINPFDKFDFSKGEWTVYLFISKSDKKDLIQEMQEGRIFKTTDKELFKEMQSHWNFKYTGGDVATVESEIILYEDGKQVFRSGIVLDKSRQGLQSTQYGWLEAYPQNILGKYCKQFDKVYTPIVILK